MRNVNVNIDPSSAPSWVLALLVAAGLVAEWLDDPEPGLRADECAALCAGAVAEWNPYTCRCREEDPSE